jgi:hypothetical protein
VNDARLNRLLRAQRAPDEVAAEERAWRVVQAAAADAPRAAYRPRGRLAIAIAAAALLLALALTGPGAAVADWVRDAIAPDGGNSRPLTSLPAPGRLLVESGQGAWVLAQDGSQRRLGPYRDATWSPHGLFIAAARQNQLVALDPKGDVHWTLARRAGVAQPRWSPDGFKIAYLSGGTLRVVAGDGTGDTSIGAAAPIAPAWQPGAKLPVLAYVDRAGAVRVVAGGSRPAVWRSAPGLGAEALQWSPDGGTLLALSADTLRLFAADGRLVLAHELPAHDVAERASFDASGRTIALVSRNAAGTRSRVTLLGIREPVRERRLLAGAGRFDGLAWSPDDDWLVVSWRTADQWLFMRVGAGNGPARKVVTFSNVGEQFDPGGSGSPAAPVPAGWCCAR